MDETLVERLIGLTEMFPERLRNVVAGLAGASWYSSKWLFNAGRVGLWVVASSAAILALPVMFENERTQMEEQQIQQQRQVGPRS
jgi:mitochondrial import receptor subunit TOM22